MTRREVEIARSIHMIAARNDQTAAIEQFVQIGVPAIEPIVAAMSGSVPPGWDHRDREDELQSVLFDIGQAGVSTLITGCCVAETVTFG